MKKWLILLLAMALLAGPAMAEAPLQRERTIYAGGAEETITETCHGSKFGYRIWVDESVLLPACTEVMCDMYFESESGEVSVQIDYLDGSWEDVRAQLAGLTAGYTYAELDTETQIALGNGLEYFTRAGVRDGICTRYYLVRHPQGMLKIIAGYPAAAADGLIAARIDSMVETIEFPQ